VAQRLEMESDFRISEWVARSGQRQAQMLIDGLRKAGLPGAPRAEALTGEREADAAVLPPARKKPAHPWDAGFPKERIKKAPQCGAFS
jgi:hypothetical protein